MTYTCAEMPVSEATFEEVKRKLLEASYDHAIHKEGLDLTHIMFTKEEPRKADVFDEWYDARYGKADSDGTLGFRAVIREAVLDYASHSRAAVTFDNEGISEAIQPPWARRHLDGCLWTEVGSALCTCPAQQHEQGPALDAFRWTGDLDAFEKWFGEKMPVDFGGQISVPVHKSNEGVWLGPWLRVWSGNWIIRHEGKCHTVTDAVYRLLNP